MEPEAKRQRTEVEPAVRKIAQLLLSEDHVKKLSSVTDVADDALASAVARGVVMYKVPEAKAQATAVPITLLPTPFARECYDNAKALGPDFHQLMDNITCDVPWLHEALASTGRLDVICGRLLGICDRVYGPGKKDPKQDVRLHVMRNDFMLDTQIGASGQPMKQIELNMIAASFSTHGQDATEAHRYVLTKHLHHLDSTLLPADAAPALERMLPKSPSAQGITAAMAEAHATYCRRWKPTGRPMVVLFVADVDEKNELDHRKLEVTLFQNHGVPSLRRSLGQLAEQKASLLAPLQPAQGTLRRSAQALVVDGYEVSVAYFRSAYWPGQFSPLEESWAVREDIEIAEAVKCPSAPAQLAGMKKVQQLLCNPATLERFIEKDKASALATTFGRQVDPSGSDKETTECVAAAKAKPTAWVLKPQVEGSGELFFDDEIPNVLNSKAQEELAEFILMERIRPPVTPSAVYRAEEGKRVQVVVRQSVGELGIFGTFVADAGKVIRNEAVGHLLRSKAKQTNQGGVFVGNAVVDVPILVPSDLFWPNVTS